MSANLPRRTDRAARATAPGELRRPIAGDVPISQIIDPLVKEGELYHKLDDGAVLCVACGHECVIKPGGRGICQVRYNLNGKLHVPWGYVAALQCDPTEKKPFNHVHPGSDTLTFGMLGCDLHCPYCFTGETVVITDRGPIRFAELFERATRVDHRMDGDAAYLQDFKAVTRTGRKQAIRAVFRHSYQGKLTHVKGYYLPELRCTPDHRLYATERPDIEPALIPAGELTIRHYLAIPRHHEFSSPQTIDTMAALRGHRVTYQTPWRLPKQQHEYIVSATQAGQTSRQIGATLGIRADYVGDVRSRIARNKGMEDKRTAGMILENNVVRFPKEHRPGIPSQIPLTVEFARLLGYYCAEGSVTKSSRRPNSLSLNFSFSKDEERLVSTVTQLLRDCLGLKAQRVIRSTTLAVSIGKSSAALLLKALAGAKAAGKYVPSCLFDAERHIVRAYIDALVDGDGHRYSNGKVSFTTVSHELAYGAAWLALKLGYLPSIYEASIGESGVIQGRKVNRAPVQYSVVWHENDQIERKAIKTHNYYLVPIRSVTESDYSGEVYNMEVNNEHSYLANFFAVSNCQNWDTSQALRDSDAGRPPDRVTPTELVALAKRSDAACVASSYNEPLITSEWAVSVFKEAKAAGLTCMYVSNGNATREVLEYIRPYTDAYKIDLKTMREANYRKLGAVLETVLDGVQMVHEMGFWLEIVTLVVPGFNDSDDELRDAARFLKSLSPDIPWHVTAFHKDYRMIDPDNTDARTLMRAAEIGRQEGLRYVYAGNMPGRVGPHEHTYCPNCHEALIERIGYVVLSYRITAEGTCPHCQTRVAGLWPKSPSEVRLGSPADLYFRAPRRVR